MKTITILLLNLCLASGTFAFDYPVVDTGQTTADAGYAGQDAHYSGNTPAYRDNRDSTISDLVTGLMWTRDPGDKMTHAEAVKNTSTCDVGGFDDWRLPTIKELYSLIKFNGTDPDPRSEEIGDLTPFIDNTVFEFRYGNTSEGERVIDSQFATSTLYVSTTMGGNKTMFGVNFADGRIKGYPMTSPRGEKTFHVLYVRKNLAYGKNEFIDNGDGTITDKATGLTWMKADSGKGMDWPSALEYAEDMEFAGQTDWRLPNAKELQSIVDYNRSPDTTGSAAIDPVFEATAITNEGGEKDFAQYWASTSHISSRGGRSGVYVAFGRSLGWMEDRRTGEKTLMDVHGAGSQRSDPKTGDASRYPQGRGPQGDVVRIDNMVRLVRGGEVKAVEPEIVPVVQTASDPPGERPTQDSGRQGLGRQGPSSDRIFSRFDANQDGRITRAEFEGPKRRFAMLDQDRNGVITREEASNAPPPQNRGERQRQGGTPRPFEEPAEMSEKSASPPPASTPANKPNIVFIYADDMGWTGTSVEMIEGNEQSKSDYYQTPNIEKLASNGMVFSQAYSPGPMCTPSRAAVLTGITPAELHITTPGAGKTDGSRKLLTPRISTQIPDDLPTIGTMLKAGGYTTALLGKWHIGRNDHAGQYGFDYHDGPTGNDATESASDPKEIFSLTERGIRFMEEAVNAGQPFYLQLSHYAVHSPVQARPESIEKFEAIPPGNTHKQTEYAAMTWDLDESLDQILQALDKLNISDNTYVVFMSDNGAGGNRRRPNNTPLFAGKGTLFEGGIRVPLIISGPDINSGYSSQAVSGTDLFATFAKWTGADIGLDESEDLTPLLTGKPGQFERKHALLFHYPHYGKGQSQVPQTALVSGQWKLLKDWESGSYSLFNLASDLGEQNDLSTKEPEVYNKMLAAMEQRLKDVNAQLPSENPNYDSAK